MDDADFKRRIEQLKAQNRIEDVARKLGLHGQGRRLWCPSCQPAGASQHKTPDLVIYDATWTCYKCGAGKGSDVIALVQLTLGCSFKEALNWFGASDGCRTPSSLTTVGGLNNSSKSTLTLDPQVVPPAPNSNAQAGAPGWGHKAEGAHQRAALEAALQAYQRALPGSAGEAYLRSRGVTLEQAQSFGLGFSAPGLWLHRSRDWRLGRVVFPTHDPNGVLLNVYGRSVEQAGIVCPNHLRHDIGVGPKGYFGSEALHQDTAFVVEGAFDRLALAQSGMVNSVAIFGTQSWRWSWFENVQHIVLCFDRDKAGIEATKHLAVEGLLRGKFISNLASSAFRGCKDLAEAFHQFGSIEV